MEMDLGWKNYVDLLLVGFLALNFRRVWLWSDFFFADVALPVRRPVNVSFGGCGLSALASGGNVALAGESFLSIVV
jgi:hypothetical protein